MSLTVIHTGKRVRASDVLDRQRKNSENKEKTNKQKLIKKTDIYPRIFWPFVPNKHKLHLSEGTKHVTGKQNI